MWHSLNPLPLHKMGNEIFSKMAVMGWWEIFTRNEGKSGMGRIEARDWFYNGWYEIFKVYSHSWKRVANPLFYKDLPILPPPFFFKFCPPLLLLPFSSPTPTLTVLSVVLFLWLNSWSHYIWCAILLNDNMDLHILSLGTRGTVMCVFVFYATKCQVYWVLTGKCGFLLVPIHFLSHTQTHSAFSFQKLFICNSYICWLDAIRLGSSCETQIILIEMV